MLYIVNLLAMRVHTTGVNSTRAHTLTHIRRHTHMRVLTHNTCTHTYIHTYRHTPHQTNQWVTLVQSTISSHMHYVAILIGSVTIYVHSMQTHPTVGVAV